MEEKDIGFGMVDSHKDAKVAKKLGELNKTLFFFKFGDKRNWKTFILPSIFQALRRRAVSMFSRMTA